MTKISVISVKNRGRSTIRIAEQKIYPFVRKDSKSHVLNFSMASQGGLQEPIFAFRCFYALGRSICTYCTSGPPEDDYSIQFVITLRPVGADTVDGAGEGSLPPEPIVTGYPGEATPVESTTKMYAAVPAVNEPCRTVAVIEVLLHADGVMMARFVQLIYDDLFPITTLARAPAPVAK